MQINRQLFEGSKPQKEKLNPVKNADWNKPAGGLWTSCDLGNGMSDWMRWCVYEGFRGPWFYVWELKVKPDARILVIDSLADLMNAYEMYPLQNTIGFRKKVLNYEKMAQDFDGISLTSWGQRTTRFGDFSGLDLYGWDCECTLWLNWAFESVEYLGEVLVDEDSEGRMSVLEMKRETGTLRERAENA